MCVLIYETKYKKKEKKQVFFKLYRYFCHFLTNEGQTKISLIINKKNQRIHFNLQNARKFYFNQLKAMKSKEYVKKITV